MAVSFIGGRNRRKSPTYRKALTNFRRYDQLGHMHYMYQLPFSRDRFTIFFNIILSIYLSDKPFLLQCYTNMTECRTQNKIRRNVQYTIKYIQMYNGKIGDDLFQILVRAVMDVIAWQLDLQLPVQSVPIITKVVNSNPVHGEVHSIQYYVIKFVCDLRQVGGFLRVFRFLSPIKLTSTIYLKY